MPWKVKVYPFPKTPLLIFCRTPDFQRFLETFGHLGNTSLASWELYWTIRRPVMFIAPYSATWCGWSRWWWWRSQWRLLVSPIVHQGRVQPWDNDSSACPASLTARASPVGFTFSSAEWKLETRKSKQCKTLQSPLGHSGEIVGQKQDRAAKDTPWASFRGPLRPSGGMGVPWVWPLKSAPDVLIVLWRQN